MGDRVKIRLVNETESDHPMPHPLHVHGAGRFFVLSRNGVEEPNLVWKDTVLVRTGQTVDTLLEVTNPGTWMMHCHIAEHHESGMMFSAFVRDITVRKQMVERLNERETFFRLLSEQLPIGVRAGQAEHIAEQPAGAVVATLQVGCVG